jgi:hypothetical protein
MEEMEKLHKAKMRVSPNWQFPKCEAIVEILTTALLRMTDVLSRLFCIHLFFMQEFIRIKYVCFANTVMSFFCVQIC